MIRVTSINGDHIEVSKKCIVDIKFYPVDHDKGTIIYLEDGTDIKCTDNLYDVQCMINNMYF